MSPFLVSCAFCRNATGYNAQNYEDYEYSTASKAEGPLLDIRGWKVRILTERKGIT